MAYIGTVKVEVIFNVDRHKEVLVAYEINGSFWACWLPFGHGLIASYYVKKVNRKLKRIKYWQKAVK